MPVKKSKKQVSIPKVKLTAEEKLAKKIARDLKLAARAERIRRRDPERMTPEEMAATRKSRATKLKLFNMTLEDDDKLREFQGHACAITKQARRKDGTPLLLNLDHNHRTGQVRGYIRGDINKALEYFEDNPAYLRAAADYLENPPAVEALGEVVYGMMGRTSKKAKNRLYGPDGTKTPHPRAAFNKEATA